MRPCIHQTQHPHQHNDSRLLQLPIHQQHRQNQPTPPHHRHHHTNHSNTTSTNTLTTQHTWWQWETNGFPFFWLNQINGTPSAPSSRFNQNNNNDNLTTNKQHYNHKNDTTPNKTHLLTYPFYLFNYHHDSERSCTISNFLVTLPPFLLHTQTNWSIPRKARVLFLATAPTEEVIFETLHSPHKSLSAAASQSEQPSPLRRIASASVTWSRYKVKIYK